MVDHDKLRDPNAEYTMRDLSAETMDITNSRGGVRDAEITDVQTTMVDGNYPWILVRVYTDAGVVGTGESYWGGGDTAIIERMKPFIVGENPLDIDRLYEHLVQKMSGEGSISGKVISAISGIEIALHDAAGKLLDVPAYQLVGGKYRDEVRVYCDLHTENEADPQACAAEAERVVENFGYDAIKFDLDVPSGHEKDRANRHLRNPEIDHKVDIVEATTEAVGDKADVAFDCHWSFTGGSAKRLAEALEEYDVWWLEDPVPPENHDVQEEVTKSTTTPIAVGENVYRKHGQRTLLEPQAVDIVAPDLPRVGGMRETRKIADLADMYYIPVAMHNVSSPIGTMASAHVGAAIPNSLALEYHSYELGWWEDLVEEDNLIEEGRMEIPEEPGLGLTLNLDAVGEHMVEGETLFDEA
ncbi:mandelate racemase/muconate lactonizing enzyme family protein [Halorubrum lacusprofundi]|jgi:D-xylonate dehydratase|uniref:Mandelate racemase/muconate lactonizing protein n=1 Tax=Halorubrum lacusprofundi (strain ATCC 49239 / DSM 5036 / JCM 8891 / ACAM 34) TaxID=416348 RepID=B9LRU5_HALLT|nr:mandelate racemase/muconate lactonizing enzyme family protein [Halorubrum lacusprofundi]ACM57819.1 Mandelate racemase/muconate lactonizing protein [Halorubrum lacusprofundi ATCC 49239]MCG1007027.1 mandelate racemase/muconate lactonizing enzyme family protein [Halorubrum lacusprofundi]